MRTVTRRYLAIAVVAFIVVLVLHEQAGPADSEARSGQPENGGKYRTADQSDPTVEDNDSSHARQDTETNTRQFADHIPIAELRRKRSEPKPAPARSNEYLSNSPDVPIDPPSSIQPAYSGHGVEPDFAADASLLLANGRHCIYGLV